MTSLIDKSFRWIILYKDGSQRYSNFLTETDVWLWEKKIGHLDKLDEIIPNPKYADPISNKTYLIQ